MKLPWSTSFRMKTLQDPCQKKFMHVHLLLSTKCSSKSHLLEQLLTVLADPLLLVVARDVVPHLLWMYCYEQKIFLFLLTVSSCQSPVARARQLSSVPRTVSDFLGGGRGGWSTTSISNWYIIWIENNFVLKLTWAQPASLQHCLAASPAILGWSIILTPLPLLVSRHTF